MAESNNYIKLPNQGNIASNMRLLYELKNSCNYSDANGYFSKSDIAEIAANALLVTNGSKLGSDVLQTIHNKTMSEGDNSPLQNLRYGFQQGKCFTIICLECLIFKIYICYFHHI